MRELRSRRGYFHIATFSSTMRHEPLSRTSTSCFSARWRRSAARTTRCGDPRRPARPSIPATIGSGTGPVADLLAPLLQPRAGAGGVGRRDERASSTERPLHPASRFAQACAQLATTSSGERATVPVERKYDGGASRQAVLPRLAGGGLRRPGSPAPRSGSAASCRRGPAAARCYARQDRARSGRHRSARSRRRRPATAAAKAKKSIAARAARKDSTTGGFMEATVTSGVRHCKGKAPAPPHSHGCTAAGHADSASDSTAP